MKIQQHVAALDGDGVVFNFDASFACVARDVLGRPVEKACPSYELNLRYHMTVEERDRVWSAMEDHPMGWSGLQLLPGALEAVTRLQKQGLEIHLVTGIRPNLAPKRLENLLKNGIGVTDIHCVGEGNQSKASVLQSLAPVMFVDDRLHLLHEVPFVPDRVWIDHGDDQAGHVVDESIVYAKSLKGWVDVWSQTRSSLGARPSIRAFGGLK